MSAASSYVGAATGELLAIDLGDRQGRSGSTAPTPADFGIGESSPAVAGGIVYIGDLTGVLHAVDAATGKAKWTFKTGAEIKSSPVVAGTRVLIGSYDGSLYALDAATGKQVWKVETENYVHATPAIWNGVAYFGGCDEIFHGVRISDGVEVVQAEHGRVHGGVGGDRRRRRVLRHVRQRSGRGRHRGEEGEVAVRGSRSPVSVLLVGGDRGRR